MSNKNKSEEDYIKDFLGGNSGFSGNGGDNLPPTNGTNLIIDDEERPSRGSKGTFNAANNQTVANIEYMSFDAKDFPLGAFYRQGTRIMIRPCTVREIQAFSTVDENNHYDVVDKMNDMLMSCVRVRYSDGTINNYLDIKDGDRLYCIFLIRELTFQSGNELAVTGTCDCKTDNEIKLHTHNMNKLDIPEDLLPYYDQHTCRFSFETMNGKVWDIGVPSIGLQKAFTKYIVEEYQKTKKLNMSFLKVVPFTISDRNHITDEGIKKHLKNFENMDEDDFMFLDAVIDKMNFGIKDLSKKCSSCDLEVHAPMEFPNGIKTLFRPKDAFTQFIKK